MDDHFLFHFFLFFPSHGGGVGWVVLMATLIG